MSKLTSSTATCASAAPAPNHPALRVVKDFRRPRTLNSGVSLSASGRSSRSSSDALPGLIARIGTSRSPGFMSKRGTAFNNALR